MEKTFKEKMFSCKEAAEYLSCSERTIRDLVRKKEIACYRFGAKRLLFKKDDLEAVLRRIGSENDLTKDGGLNVKQSINEGGFKHGLS